MAPQTREQKLIAQLLLAEFVLEAVLLPSDIDKKKVREEEDSGKDVEPPQEDELSLMSKEYLGRHLLKNRNLCRQAFGVKVSDTKFLIDPKTGRPLACHKINKHVYVSPYLYRPGYRTLEESFDVFIKRFAGMHKFTAAEIEEVVKIATPAFLNLFTEDDISENLFRSNVQDLYMKITAWLLKKGFIKLLKEVPWAVRGLLAWGLGDDSVGVIGFCDHVLYSKDKKPFGCNEYKKIPQNNFFEGHRWFSVSKALMAQIYGALVGLNAKFGIAWSPMALKFLWNCGTKEKGPQFAVCPQGEEFWVARSHPGDTRPLRIIVHSIAACIEVEQVKSIDKDLSPLKLRKREDPPTHPSPNCHKKKKP